jgi:hypothetical protein
VVGSDPYPNLATGDEIPGTRKWSTNETSWGQFYENSVWAGWRCPTIYGPNGDPYAAESNGYDNSVGKWFRVCVKNPWREPVNPQVQANYEKLKSDAQAAALALSEQWNKEHEGEQKCFPWGPITSPSGGTESGGVCANVVGSPKPITSQSNSETRTATASDSSTAVLYSQDPLPQYANGQEIPGTRVNGQVSISCPSGSGSSIEVNATTKAVYTYCSKNWTPTRVTQAVSDTSTMVSQSDSTTATASQTQSVPTPKTSSVDTATAVASSDPIDFKGSIKQIAEVVQTLEISNTEETAINNVTAKLASIKTTSKLVKIVLPNSQDLEEIAVSLTPAVCKVSGLVVQPKKAGTCSISYTFEGESGNSFETTKKVVFTNDPNKLAAAAKTTKTFTLVGTREANCTSQDVNSNLVSASVVVPPTGGTGSSKYIYKPGTISKGSKGASVSAGVRELWAKATFQSPYVFQSSTPWYSDIEITCSYQG